MRRLGKKAFLTKLWDSLVAVFILALAMLLVFTIFMSSNPARKSQLAFEDSLGQIKNIKSTNEFLKLPQGTANTGAALLADHDTKSDEDAIRDATRRYFTEFYASTFHARINLPQGAEIAVTGSAAAKQRLDEGTSVYAPLEDGELVELKVMGLYYLK